MITVCPKGKPTQTFAKGVGTKTETTDDGTIVLIVDKDGKPIDGASFKQEEIQSVQAHDAPLPHLPPTAVK